MENSPFKQFWDRIKGNFKIMLNINCVVKYLSFYFRLSEQRFYFMDVVILVYKFILHLFNLLIIILHRK